MMLTWLIFWQPFLIGALAGVLLCTFIAFVYEDFPKEVSRMLRWFFESNSWGGRLARTVVQALIGFVLAYANELVALIPTGPSTQALIVAAVMAVLSPVMQLIGSAMDKRDYDGLE